jgi:hypothetical protein
MAFKKKPYSYPTNRRERQRINSYASYLCMGRRIKETLLGHIDFLNKMLDEVFN